MRRFVLDLLDDLSNHVATMNKPILTWTLVDDTAVELGATEAARRKWRTSGRQVPFEWRMKIIEALAAKDMAIVSADFDRLPETPGRIAA